MRKLVRDSALVIWFVLFLGLLLGAQKVFNPSTPAAAGGVTSVSGTANQIDVATGTTNPVLSIDPTFTFPGTVTNPLSIFGATTSAQFFSVILDETGSGSVVGGTGPTLSNPIVGTQSASDNSTKAASTAYVTTAVANAIAGVNPAVAVKAATTQASDTSGLTYSNGVGGIGATFTGTVNTALTIDGVTFTALNQRLLVKNDTQSPSGAFNGVYYVTQVQTGILPPVLTRALDYDAPSDINSTGAIPVQSGTVNASTSWLLTSTVTTVGTDPLTYVQFSYNPTNVALLNAANQTFTAQQFFTSNFVQLASAYTTDGTANAQTMTGMTFTLPASTALKAHLHCQGSYHQTTGTAAVSFGVINSVAPTNGSIYGKLQQNTTTTLQSQTLAIAGTLTAVAVSGTPSAITSEWNWEFDYSFEQPSGSANTIGAQVKTGTGADTVVVSRDSFCTLGF